jgi:hypothetical protein
VDAASRALCLKFLGRETPERTLDLVRQALVKAGLSELGWQICCSPTKELGGMHGMALYGGRYDLEFHDFLILVEIPEYLRTIGRVLGMETMGPEVGMHEVP